MNIIKHTHLFLLYSKNFILYIITLYTYSIHQLKHSLQ